MKRKALAILIKEIIKRNSAIILSAIGFVVTLAIGIIIGNDISVTFGLAVFIALICEIAYMIIFFIVVTFIQLKTEYDNILDNLNNCHDENK